MPTVKRRKLSEQELEQKRQANPGVWIGGKMEGEPVQPTAEYNKAAEQRSMAQYGTTDPTQSQILQRLYGIQKGGEPAPKQKSQGMIRAEEQAQQQKIQEMNELREMASIDELNRQILQPDLMLRNVGTSPEGRGAVSFAPFGRIKEPILINKSADFSQLTEDERQVFGVGNSNVLIPEQDLMMYEGRRQVGGLITTRIDNDSSVISAEAQLLFAQLTTKTAGLLGANIVDKRMQNMEGALINHKESSAQVIRALQVGAYTPQQAMERLELMRSDADIIEETMQLLSIHSPATYNEMKGWEYTTRLQKIREAIMTNEQAVINYAETGQILENPTSALAFQLNEYTST